MEPARNLDPPEAVDGESRGGALRLVARREHELLALSELSQELTISLDIYTISDLILFNLMGQVGTSRAALWMRSEESSEPPVLIRAHGLTRPSAVALGSSMCPVLIQAFEKEHKLLLGSALERMVGEGLGWMLRREEIALVAPIVSRGEILGILALGNRINGTPYGPAELQVLQTSLGMVGVAIQNTTLYNRLLENNRQLRLANENLQEMDELKSQFLRNVNHELRTPLTIIIAYLSNALEDEGVQHARDFMTISLQEATKLKGLIENLLTFSAVSADQLPVTIESKSLAAILSRFHEDRLPGLTRGLREFSLQLAPELPAARVDETRLLQILNALVDNAVKYTPQGSHVRLRGVVMKEEGVAWACIEVEDNGPGIPPEHLPYVFDSFRQGDGSTTRTIGGMGVGLAMASKLAERLGGKLTVDSSLGKGTTFRLCLPAEERRAR